MSNLPPPPPKKSTKDIRFPYSIPEAYINSVKNRGVLRYYIGLIIRWIQNFKYSKARRIARKRGAKIGRGVILPISLAKKANKNLVVGNHTSIQTDKIDLRSPVTIGNNVIIGVAEIITTSHNIDSSIWEHKYYGIEIADYSWIATHALILPNCRKIGFGAVIGAGSVVVKNVEPMCVVGGNPAKEIRKRKTPHTDLVVEALLGGDYDIYRQAQKTL